MSELVGEALIELRGDGTRLADDVRGTSKSIDRDTKSISAGFLEAGKRISKVLTVASAVGPALMAGGAALSAVAAGGVAVAGALGPAAAAGIGVYAGSYLALAQGVGVAKFAMDGMAEAATGDAEAIAKLGPAGRSFASTLGEMIPRIDKVRRSAQEGMFPGVEEATKRLARAYFPALNVAAAQTGAVLGDLARQGGRLATSGPWRADFGTVTATNSTNLRLMGRAGLALADAARSLLVTALPLTTTFLQWAAGAAESVNSMVQAGRASGELAAFWERAGAAGAQLGGILGNIGVAFYNIFRIGGADAGQELLDAATRITAEFRAWTASDSGAAKIGEWFATGRDNLAAMGRLVSAVTGGLSDMGSGAALAPLVDQITNEVIPPLMEFLENASASGALSSLVSAVGAVLEVFAQLAEHDGSLKAFAATLEALANAALWITQNVPGAGAALGALFTVLGVSSALSFVGLGGAVSTLMTMLGSLVGSVAAAVGPIIGQFALMSAQAIFHAGRAAGAWLLVAGRTAAAAVATMVASAARVVAAWVLMATQALIQAARMAAAWLIALGPIGWAIAAVIAVAAIVILNWDRIKRYTLIAWAAVSAAVRIAWAAIRGAVSAAASAVRGVIVAVWSAVQSRTSSAWSAIRGVISSAVAAVRSVIQRGFAAIRSLIASVLAAIRAVVTTAWAGIRTAISTAMAAVRSVVSSGFNAVRSIATSVARAILAAVRSAFQTIRSTVSSVMGAIRAVISSGFNAARAAVSSAMSAARGAVSAAMGAIKGAVSAGIGAVVGLFQAMGGRIRGAVRGLAGALRSAGVAMIQGLIGGISSMASAVASKARSVVSSAISAARSALKIGSPSRVFKRIGIQTIQGYVQGMDGSRELVDKSLERVFAGVRRWAKEHKLSARATAGMIRGLQDEARALRANASARDRLNERMAETRSMGRDIANGIIDANKLSTLQAEEGQPVTAQSLVEGMRARAKEAVAFAANIAKLRKRGLNEAAIRDLASTGVAAGAQAAALAAASAVQIAALNASQAVIARAARSTGTTAVQGLVDGINAQLKSVDAAGVRLARALRAAIRRELKIKSPSLVFRDLGVQTGLGLIRGLDAMRLPAALAGRRLATATVPRAPLIQPGGGRFPAPGQMPVRPGNTAKIDVHLPTGDPQAAAQAVAARWVLAGITG